MKNLVVTVLIFSLVMLIQGCLDAGESDYEKQIREADELLKTYITNNNIEAERHSSGVYVEVIETNPDGKQMVEDHVAGIVYTMIHLEGDYEIEVHADTTNPVRFSNSYNAVNSALHPAGLNYAIRGMRQGETFRFYIPSYQAYGDYFHEELFDSYSHFIMEVHLAELKTEEEIYEEELEKIHAYLEENDMEAENYPNGLFYHRVEPGDGDKLSNVSQAEFHYTRKYLDGNVIETSTNGDPIRNLNPNQMVRGLEEGLLLMKEGESAELIMPSKLAFGKSIQVLPLQLREYWEEESEINPLTRPYAPVTYEVELLNIN